MSELKITPGQWSARRVPTYETTAPGQVRVTGIDPNRWYVNATFEHTDDPIIARTMTHIAHVERCGDMSDEELEANARGIASLPDLIEAAENVKGAFDTPIMRRRLEGNDFALQALASLRSAINSAKGGD
jgi:hypothetical protein